MTAAYLKESLQREIARWPRGIAEGVVGLLGEQGCTIQPRCADHSQLVGLLCLALQRIAAMECVSLQADVATMGMDVESHVATCIQCQLIKESDLLRSARVPAVVRLIIEISRKRAEEEMYDWRRQMPT